MALFRVNKADLEQFTVVTNPFRTFSSSSVGGATGSVYIYPRRSSIEKDATPSSVFVDATKNDSDINATLSSLQLLARSIRHEASIPSPEQAVPTPPATNLVLATMPDSIVSSNGSVSRWGDKSGFSQDFLQSTPSRQPLLVPGTSSKLSGFPGIQTGPNGAGTWITSTLASNLDTTKSTIYVMVQFLADGIAGVKTFMGMSGLVQLDRAEFPVGSGSITPFIDYPYPPEVQAFFASYIQQPILFAMVGDGSNQTLYANGVQVAQQASAAAQFSTILLGSTNPGLDAFSSPNVFFEVLAYNVGHTPTQRQTVEAYFANKYGVQVVFDGNSQVAGDHSSGGGTTIPGFTPHLVGTWVSYTNNGTNGKTTPQLTSRIATTIALFNTQISQRVLVMLEIENDLSINGASGTPSNTTYATTTGWSNIVAYSRAARLADAQKLVICTGLPIGALIPPAANYENSRQALNAIVRSTWNAIDSTTGLPYFDALADIGGDTSLVGPVSATTNAGLYDPLDQQHLNDGGVAAAAPIIAAAISFALQDNTTFGFAGAMSDYLAKVTAQSVSAKQFSSVAIDRIAPTVTFTENTLKKSVIKDLLNPFYRTVSPSAHYAYTNYNALNFFTSSTVPSDSALLYPNVQAPVSHAGYVSGTYSLSGAFSFDMYLNPRYQSFLTDGQFKAGTVLHLSGCYALSLVTGSLKDVNGRPKGFRLQLQLSQSANIPPSLVVSSPNTNSSSVPSWAKGDLVFLSDDNSLTWNNWHHVIVRWGTNLVNRGTGSFNIDGVDRGLFAVGSSSISPKYPMPTGLSGPDVLVVGNYFEGSNAATGSMSYFFAADPALRDGLVSMNGVTGVEEPTAYSFNHHLNAEVHELSIKRFYLSDDEIEASSSVGMPFVDPARVALYVPPFFIESSPTRQFVGTHGGVLQTPFFEVNGTTVDPFNVAMAFGVGGHYINAENFTYDFANAVYPRLHHMSGVALTTTTALEQANQFLYQQPWVIRRNLLIVPCDDGNFVPSFALLSSQSMRFTAVDDMNVPEPSFINLDNMVSTASLLFGTDFYGDSTFPDAIIGSTAEQPGLAAGTAMLSYKRTVTDSVSDGTFTPGVQDGQPLDIYERTRDASSDQITIFDVSNLYYGKRIMPTSFVLSDSAFSASGGAMKFTLNDDGFGNLYRADCFTSQSTWNSVGNLYYDEGLVLIKSPHLNFFGKEGYSTSFRGTQSVHVMKLNVLAPANALNSSSNPSYVTLPPSPFPNDPSADFVYVAGINFHDEDFNVVAKAQLAQPILKRPGDRIAFNVRIDF